MVDILWYLDVIWSMVDILWRLAVFWSMEDILLYSSVLWSTVEISWYIVVLSYIYGKIYCGYLVVLSGYLVVFTSICTNVCCEFPANIPHICQYGEGRTYLFIT